MTVSGTWVTWPSAELQRSSTARGGVAVACRADNRSLSLPKGSAAYTVAHWQGFKISASKCLISMSHICIIEGTTALDHLIK
jgi:hypothetical protein